MQHLAKNDYEKSLEVLFAAENITKPHNYFE
jgi:hypothetical protein